MNVGDWVIWHDLPGQVITVFNDGINLVIRVPYSGTPSLPVPTPRMEVIQVNSEDCALITKEVADIMKADL